MRLLTPFLAALLWSANALAEFPQYAHPVMTWVPPYGVAKLKSRLNESFDGAGAGDGLTHLGLQFWTPAQDGTVARVGKPGELRDAAIAEFRTWGHAHGVRVLLCVYNGSGATWDWPLARAAFVEHREKFVAALVEEATRLELDGIDVDLEGNGSFDADRDAYLAFLRELVQRAHAAHQQVTVDTFAYKWNAPNQTWWKELLPLVDALTCMGYEETGAKSEDWRAYAAQKAAAGPHAAKLMIGLPAHKDSWQGLPAIQHLRWLRDHAVGAALWDGQLNAAAWRTGDVWTTLGQIRGRP